MAAIQYDMLPPEESWLPGRLLGPVVLHYSDSLHVVFADADVYPAGILLHLTARFRDLPTLDAQREVGRQVNAFHYAAADHEGPHLCYHPQPGGTVLEDALPSAHRGSGRVWHLGYWVACDVASAAPLAYVMEWPAQAVHSAFGFTQERVDEARRAARQLWPGDIPWSDAYSVGSGN